MGRLRAILAAPLVALLLCPPAAAAPKPPEPVIFSPPVPGPVIDPYRPPSTPYGPGNRGIDYATTPGEPVGAPADGVVTFAGPVAGALHVVILHADGIRTSLSFLAVVLVTRNLQVVRGQTVGRSAASLHLGARRGEVYLDPATLFTDSAAAARSVLVPEGPGRPLGVEEEAAGLRRLLADLAARTGPWSASGMAGSALSAAGRSAAEVADLVRTAATVGAPPGWVVLAAAASTLAEQGPCTTPASPVPPRPPGLRLLVLVGGLGSSSGAAAVFDLNVAALGYSSAEVVRFSYRGGTTAENRYEPSDTLNGIDEPAARLAKLLARLRGAHPGRPIDIVAHSMGGLVVRAALATPPRPAAPATVVTLGTPHRGADMAAIARLSSASVAGRLMAEGLAATPGGPAPASRSVADLAPGSPFLTRLAATGPPGPPTRAAGVGARTDLVVPPPDARWRGVPSTTVDVASAGVNAHGALPGSPAATREVALAISGAPPTCRSGTDALGDAAFGLAVQGATYGVGGATAVALAGMVPVGPVPPALRGG